jgi:hypothetical protein
MNSATYRSGSAAVALLALIALLTACTNYDPRNEPTAAPPTPSPTAVATPAATPEPTAAPTSSPTPAPTTAPTATPTGPIGSARVVLTIATADRVTIDVTDASGTLLEATSGAPGDGATVEAYALIVRNLSPKTIRLTWTGGPCDNADRLWIDASRKQLLLVQPGCSGDAVATDRILDHTFSTPIKAADLDAYLQEGLDT